MSQQIIIEPTEAKALEELLPLVEKNFGPGKTFLFGSRARRDYRDHSDIDLIHVVAVAPDDADERRKRHVFRADKDAAGAVVPFSVQILVFSTDRLEAEGAESPTFPEALREMIPVRELLDAFHDPANAGKPPTRVRPSKLPMFVDFPPEDPMGLLFSLSGQALLGRNSNGQWTLVDDCPDHPFEPDTVIIDDDIVFPLIERGFIAERGETWRMTPEGTDAWEKFAVTGVSEFDEAASSSMTR